jgi:hypothetical protein
MEVLIGFAVGYWAGTRRGRQGLDEALDTAREIWASPEARRMLGEGLATLQAATPAVFGKRGREVAVIREVIDDLVERRSRRPARVA